MRETITLRDSMADIIQKMGERNPGGLNVAMQILEKSGPLALLDFDDMGIRGQQLWVAYKDFAKQDLAVLLAAGRNRDPLMVEIVNRESAYLGFDYVAVTSGASWKDSAK